MLDLTTLEKFDRLEKLVPNLLPTLPQGCEDLREPLPPKINRIRFDGESYEVDVTFDTTCLEPPEPDPGNIDPVPTDAPVQGVLCRSDGTAGIRISSGGGRSGEREERAGLTCVSGDILEAKVGQRMYPQPDGANISWKIDREACESENPEECPVVFTPLEGDIDPTPDTDTDTAPYSLAELTRRLNSEDAQGRAVIEIDCDAQGGLFCPYDWTALDVTSFEMAGSGDGEKTYCERLVDECAYAADQLDPDNFTDEDHRICTSEAHPDSDCGQEVQMCYNNITANCVGIDPASRAYDLCYEVAATETTSCVDNAWQNGACVDSCGAGYDDALTDRNRMGMFFRKVDECLADSQEYQDNCVE